jgi:DNA-binding NarL/FixJ family response regulator
MILFLDDDPYRTKRFRMTYPSAHTFETAQQIIDALDRLEAPAEVVFLDHDLGGETFVDSSNKNTGMEVVRWIEEHRPPIDKIVVHSMNHPAAERMGYRLEASGYEVSIVPFITLKLG